MSIFTIEIIAGAGGREAGLLAFLSPLFTGLFTAADYLELFFISINPEIIVASIVTLLLISIWALIKSRGKKKGVIFLYFSIGTGLGGFALLINRQPTYGLISLMIAAGIAGISARFLSPLARKQIGRKSSSRRIWFFFILVFALITCFYRLDSIPASTTAFEVSSGMSALQLIHKVKPGISKMLWSYMDRTYAGSPTSPFFVYFTAGLFQIFGVGLLTIRIVGAFWGLMSLVMLYLLINDLFDQRLALLATLLTAILPWFLSVARLGSYPSLSLTYFLAVLILFMRGIWGKYFYLIPAGVLFSLITYFYLPVKVLIPLLILLWLHSLLINKQSFRKNILGIFIFLAAYSAISLLIGNPVFRGLLGVASRNTFVGSPMVQPGFNLIWALTDLYLKASAIFYILFYRAHELFYPYPHGPLVNRGILLLAGLGFGWSIRRWKERGYFLLSICVVAAFLPVLLVTPQTNSQDTARRCFLAAPFIASLAAIILGAVLNGTASIWRRAGPALGRTAVGIFIISSALLNLNRYFNSPPYPFGGALWEFQKAAGELFQQGYRLEVIHGHPYVEYNLREVVDFEAWVKTGQIYSFYAWDGPRRIPEQPRVESIVEKPICRHWPSDRLEEALRSAATENSAVIMFLEYPYEARSSPARIHSFDPRARVTMIKDQKNRTIGFQYLPGGVATSPQIKPR